MAQGDALLREQIQPFREQDRPSGGAPECREADQRAVRVGRVAVSAETAAKRMKKGQKNKRALEAPDLSASKKPCASCNH